MAKSGTARERILAIAERGVLAKGFGATSIEEIVAEAEITKSGFFYHFRDKNELARALIERYIVRDEEVFDFIEVRAQELSDDPLQAFLISLKLLAEILDDVPNGHPGCLIASYTYQERLFDRDVTDLNRQALLSWRQRFRRQIDRILDVYDLKDDVDPDALADMISSTIEGALVIAKAMREPRLAGQQIMLLRSYFKLLFLRP